jgi:DNA-3-methyladenine glycosylase II
VTAATGKIGMRSIRNEKDLKEGVTALVKSCAQMARIYALAGDPPLRRRPSGFKGLVRVITSQQLSVASAGAIWQRVEAAVEPFTPSRFLATPEQDLRAAGLSKIKVATLRGLAEAIDTGSLDLDTLSGETEDIIHAKLTALKGIGPWTADIYILFCLARADAWSPGDLALQVAVKDALELDARPDQALMKELAEAWRPWRAVAARMLWAYYGLRRKTSAAPA